MCLIVAAGDGLSRGRGEGWERPRRAFILDLGRPRLARDNMSKKNDLQGGLITVDENDSSRKYSVLMNYRVTFLSIGAVAAIFFVRPSISAAMASARLPKTLRTAILPQSLHDAHVKSAGLHVLQDPLHRGGVSDVHGHSIGRVASSIHASDPTLHIPDAGSRVSASAEG